LLAHIQGFSIGCLGFRRLSETPVNATGWIEEARRAHTETLAREK